MSWLDRLFKDNSRKYRDGCMTEVMKIEISGLVLLLILGLILGYWGLRSKK